MDLRRAQLKELAARSARLWGNMPIPPALRGETRVETRNTVYRLRDGICERIDRDGGGRPGSAHPDAFVGMRIVGWLLRDDPRSPLSLEWQPGAYAVLWRPRMGPTDRSAVALTSPTIAFQRVVRSVTPAPSGIVRVSTPPPLPAAAQRRTAPPIRPALAQPPTPPSVPRPPPPSTTRLHPSQVPAPPETPTPLMRPSTPPPLPPQARPRATAAVRPQPFRPTAVLS
jgi:hypothetical protein